MSLADLWGGDLSQKTQSGDRWPVGGKEHSDLLFSLKEPAWGPGIAGLSLSCPHLCLDCKPVRSLLAPLREQHLAEWPIRSGISAHTDTYLHACTCMLISTGHVHTHIGSVPEFVDAHTCMEI